MLKAGFLGVAWFHENILKHRSLWTINVPQDSSWCCRKLLNARQIAWDMIKHIAGNGTSIYLWWDYWHPNDPLLKVYDRRIMYDVGLPLHVTLSSVIENGVLSWPPARENLVEIYIGICDIVDTLQLVVLY